MKYLIVAAAVLGVVWYLHRRQQQINFDLWVEVNSLKLRGVHYGELLED